jgi:hypothetical protein
MIGCRTPVRTLLVGAFAVLGSCLATAGDYPDRNITLVVPFAPGGTSDIVARLVGEHMAKTLGQPIIVENDAGAGGTVAGRRVAQAAADGYTLIIGTLGTHGAAPSQYPSLKYDPRRDFTPIGQTSEMPFVLVARKDFPANNLKEFVDYIQRNQDKVSEAHAGVGSEIHAACTLLQYCNPSLARKRRVSPTEAVRRQSMTLWRARSISGAPFSVPSPHRSRRARSKRLPLLVQSGLTCSRTYQPLQRPACRHSRRRLGLLSLPPRTCRKPFNPN